MPELYISKYATNEGNLIVKILKNLEKVSLQFADRILTANESFKYIFIKRNNINPDKISVILNCPDPLIFKPSAISKRPATNGQFTLMYMGTIDERFCLDIAIYALPKLIKYIPNIRFIIIPKLENEGKYFQKLKSKIKYFELDKYIEILKPLPLEKIYGKIKEADIGIVLAKDGIFTQKIFPVKLLEFIQMGIPVIATKTQTLAKYFQYNQISFLSQNNSSEFSKNVIKLFKDKNTRDNISINAKEFLIKYNWIKEENKYMKIISS